MDVQKERFLRNEFLTMSVLGALGRSRTYSESASEEAKNRFRDALREKLDGIANEYRSPVKEEEHLSNIAKLADDLTSRFSNCLRDGRFRIGIAQKALNLYLKYLWCVDLIPLPPHCPLDSIVIGHIPECSELNWTSIDSIADYQRLVTATRKIAKGKALPEWELRIWGKPLHLTRPGVNKSHTPVRPKRVGESSGWRKFASKFHGQLINAMMLYPNQILETSKIRGIIENVPAFKGKEQWIYPSDHCINHWNKGACYCALKEEAIFERLARGRYRVKRNHELLRK